MDLTEKINQLQWYQSQEHPCSYFEERTAKDIFCKNENLTTEHYDVLHQNGFRRSGSTFYKPNCTHCSDCIPLRILPKTFKLSKSQRKVKNKNTDLTITYSNLSNDSEHLSLYNEYQESIHNGNMSADKTGFNNMFSHKGFTVNEIQFRLQNKLIGVSIIDVTENSLSSVYFYYDPNFAKRSLGTFSVIAEISFCIQNSLAYWYGGFTLKDCKKMSYKNNFKPAQNYINNIWVDVD